jgi:hypothetical protein
MTLKIGWALAILAVIAGIVLLVTTGTVLSILLLGPGFGFMAGSLAVLLGGS